MISGTDLPAASKPKTPKVLTKSKPPQKRKQALVHPPLQSVLSRNALILPETTDNYDAAIYPMLNGVPEHQFSVIMADPPFQYRRQIGTGVADNHYETMTDERLSSLPVNKITTKNALLLLWCSGPTLLRAAELCKSWGFSYKTVAFVWIKTSAKRSTPQSMGLGYYTKPGTEFVLVATKGHGPSLIHERINQVFAAPREAHSQKPYELRSMVNVMTGADSSVHKLELFSRKRADSIWSAWGDQLPDVNSHDYLDPSEDSLEMSEERLQAPSTCVLPTEAEAITAAAREICCTKCNSPDDAHDPMLLCDGVGCPNAW
jgi:N6-adenosine-specific RNA methylase IME4